MCPRRFESRKTGRSGYAPACANEWVRGVPEAKSGRWGQGLTKAKMAECQWLKPVLVGQFEFLEWTGDNHLRHSKFVGLREDKKASDVVRE